ncbi:Periplasmic serine endoprotease DegP [Candidatus Magnetaquicoccaceae bacterium FCR-1]|uniref:Probable periplasmic serine endoprotease DegP-like n=1 Tax=Candidatus Magnetaquiglobus chichijimensis TaxID=3141448 RepID=A0ABQ0C998_9PROT
MSKLTGRLLVVCGLLWMCLGLIASAEANNLPDLVPLVKKLQPVVVNISTSQKVHASAPRQGGKLPRRGQPQGESPLDELFRRFFEDGPNDPPSMQSRSLGSGVIIDDAGHILTNHHVVDEADEILVRLSDERELVATVVGRDAKSDLALIRIKSDGKLPVATLGNSDQAEVGSWVVAIGNPFGLEASVTMGIISARGRSIGSGPYDNFLQTDAAINPGNSGGPLFNLQGEVIGINTAIFSRSGGNMGIGFAIPINMAKSIVAQLRESGKVTRGWLGVRIQTVTKELAEALGLGDQRGALVASVEPKSPAEAAGVRSGDVIVRFDGHEVGRMKELPAIVAETPVNKKVTMEVVRAGESRKMEVVIAAMRDDEPAEDEDEERDAGSGKQEKTILGVVPQALTSEWRERLELPAGIEGVVVANVESGSPADQAGMRPGDLIQELNRKPIKSVEDLRAVLGKANPGQTLLVLMRRGSDPLFLAVPLPAKKP